MANDRIQAIDSSVHIASQAAIDDTTTPVFQEFRRISGTVKNSYSYGTSGIVDPTGQAPSQFLESQEYMAEIETEYTDLTKEFFKKAIHGEEVLVNVTGSDIAFTAAGVDSGTSNAFADLVVGDFFFVSDSASNNGWHSIATKTDNNNVTLKTAPTVESAGASITVYSRKVTSDKNKYYDIMQERLPFDAGVGGIGYKTMFNGQINSCSISVPEEGAITTNYNYMFAKTVAGSAAIAGQTDSASDDSDSYSATNISNFWINGVSKLCEIKTLELSIENNYEIDKAAGCDNNLLGKGNISASASVTARTSSTNPYVYHELAANAFDVSLSFGLKSNDDTKESVYSLARCKISEPDRAINGVFLDTSFTAAGQASKEQNTTVTVYSNF